MSIQADQLIFTSLRTPTGEGYRIVASTATVKAAEKKEITQRAPSHGSLCDPSPSGHGVSSYLLDSGRHCVALSRNAGREHTARGGWRVHTHMVLLPPDAFATMACDPFRVVRALRRATGEEPLVDPAPQLQRLELHSNGAEAPAPALSSGERERMLYVLGSLLHDWHLLVVGQPQVADRCPLILQAMPLQRRRSFSMSCGLKFSPSRNFQLIVLNASTQQTQRFAERPDAVFMDWAKTTRPTASDYDPWLDFIRQHWKFHRFGEIDGLCRRISESYSPQSLQRIAQLYRAIQAAQVAQPSYLDHLAGVYAAVRGRCPLQDELLAQLREVANKRREELERQKEQEAEQASGTQTYYSPAE